MTLDALRIDPDDVAFDLLPAIERAFGIVLPTDLRHVRTAGDLHRLILAHAPGESGAACGTLMAFHLIRRALSPLGLYPRAGPGLPLKDAGLPSPKQARAALRRAGLEPPPLVGGGWLLGSIGVAVLGSPAAWWAGHPWWAAAMPALCWGAARLDPGGWRNDWATLGGLARATAALNHARLVERGARHSPAAVWNSLRTLIAGLGPDRDTIGVESRLV